MFFFKDGLITLDRGGDGKKQEKAQVSKNIFIRIKTINRGGASWLKNK